MKLRIFTILGLFTVGWAGVAGWGLSAEAKPTKHQKKVKVQLESYPALEEVEVATESEPSEIRVSRTQSVTVPSSSLGLDSIARSRALEERVALLEKRYVERATENAIRPSTTPAASTAAYDLVPAGKTDMIAARLALVETILRESGRAYDYRVTTTPQLRRILESVRAEKNKVPTLAE